jgi:hypothetical protein
VRIHFLTQGMVSPNGRAFFYPLIRYRAALRESGVEWHAFTQIQPALFECDVVCVESKYHQARWRTERARILDEFAGLRQQARRLVFFDLGDSSSYLVTDVLPLVDWYGKGQLLRDRTRYGQPLYGSRAYTDFYHHQYGVMDTDPVTPVFAPDLDGIDKLRLSWNFGLADYSLTGPWRLALYQRLPLDALFSPQFDHAMVDPAAPRPRQVACRITTAYARASVAWQRRQIRDALPRDIQDQRVSRRRYLHEMATSRIVVSPFGWGELAYRDFEAFRSGALLLKPSMAHMETWPDFFSDEVTMASFRWDITDLQEVIDGLLADDMRRLAIARTGQETYRRALDPRHGAADFCAHVQTLFTV